MSQMIKWTVGLALVLAAANSALAARKHVPAVRADAEASVPAPPAGEPEYFAQAKGDVQ